MRERRKPKEKNIRKWGYSEREMVILGCHEFFGVLLALQNYENVPETANATEVSCTDPDKTDTGNSEQLEGENIMHDQKMEGGSSQNQQPAGLKKGDIIQKLTAVDTGKQYLDALKEISNEWR